MEAYDMVAYRLPDGRIVQVNAFSGCHARPAPEVIDYQLKGGAIVKAERADCNDYGYASSETAYGLTVNYGFAVKVF